MAETGDYLDVLSRFACETRLDDIPVPVRERCRVIIADMLAVIAAGMQESEMQALVANHVPRVATGNAAVIGSGKRCNPLDAALLWFTPHPVGRFALSVPWGAATLNE